MSKPYIRKGYRPGAIGRVVELHGRYYHQNWNFGLFFEGKVARDLSEFMDRYDEGRDGFWIADRNGRLEGSIAIDGVQAREQGAHLRWFIVSAALQGQGLGNRLLDEAMAFCKNMGYGRVYLWTFEGLQAARHLYEKAGFKLKEQYQGRGWGRQVNEQHFELLL
ncbi:MAG: GNAT family N-acetyltransferase [Desulfohalobiaceae bacterium]|nr:GNAT family N-acetyltransferase [Desulfohalobiaceae bacterium]